MAARADEHVFRGAGIVEEDFAKAAGTIDCLDRADGHAGLAQVDKQIGNTIVLARVGLRAHEGIHPVALIGKGAPDLLAIEHPLSVLKLGTRPERGKVAARLRLGIALRPLQVAVEDRGNEARLLGFGAMLQQGRQDHRGAVAPDLAGGPDAGELLAHDQGLQHIGWVARCRRIFGGPNGRDTQPRSPCGGRFATPRLGYREPIRQREIRAARRGMPRIPVQTPDPPSAPPAKWIEIPITKLSISSQTARMGKP